MEQDPADVRIMEGAAWETLCATLLRASERVMGEGVPENYVEAYAWWSVAATNGDEFAKRVLPKGKAKLTPEQLVTAQKRAAELLEQINANEAK